jgi:hypothetical protein
MNLEYMGVLIKSNVVGIPPSNDGDWTWQSQFYSMMGINNLNPILGQVYGE